MTARDDDDDGPIDPASSRSRGATQQNEERTRQIRMLDGLIAIETLVASEADMFDSMKRGLSRFPTLTPKQLKVVERAAYREGLWDEMKTEAERQRVVPRGREVEPAPVLRNLPKSPPGRMSRDEAALEIGDYDDQNPMLDVDLSGDR